MGLFNIIFLHVTFESSVSNSSLNASTLISDMLTSSPMKNKCLSCTNYTFYILRQGIIIWDTQRSLKTQQQ